MLPFPFHISKQMPKFYSRPYLKYYKYYFRSRSKFFFKRLYHLTPSTVIMFKQGALMGCLKAWEGQKPCLALREFSVNVDLGGGGRGGREDELREITIL